MEKHATATVYLAAKIAGKTKVLLHRHKKINIWMGVGGHVEPNENPWETALREVKEETGVTPKLLPQPGPLARAAYYKELPPPSLFFEFKLSPYKHEPMHYHIDFVYFGTVADPGKVSMQEEFRWLTQEDLRQLDLQKEVHYITRRAFEIAKKHL